MLAADPRGAMELVALETAQWLVNFVGLNEGTNL
jgi:hypothetical protein